MDARPEVDAEIWERARSGDRRGALTMLMSTYGQKIYAFCLAMMRTREMADDVHQIVFTQAYDGLEQLADRPAFRPWLLAIARNRCLDELKKRRRWLARFQPADNLPEAIGSEPAVDESLQKRQEMGIVGHCLDDLAPQVRTAVLLRYLEEMSYEQIARICREPAATLQKRVVRALDKLRQCAQKRAEAA
jgi:RNA polymerase sigma-70 factor, ECF subfamily